MALSLGLNVVCAEYMVLEGGWPGKLKTREEGRGILEGKEQERVSPNMSAHISEWSLNHVCVNQTQQSI